MDLEVAKFLIKTRPDIVNHRDMDGRTGLDYLYLPQYEDVLDYINKNGL